MNEEYFTNRQDRCVVVRHKEFSDFCVRLIELVSGWSFRVDSDGNAQFPEGLPRPYDDPTAFCNGLRHDLLGFLESFKTSKDFSANDSDSWIFPFIQFGPLGIRQEEGVFSEIVSMCGSDCKLDIASGYFNFPQSYSDVVLKAAGKINILAASPKVCV